MEELIVSARTAALNYTASTRSLTAARERRDLMQETVEIMQARYEAGIADQTDLLDVALERDQARLAYIRALFDCLLSHARFLRSIGKLEVTK
jgi:outer membrane protein TolC